MLTIVLTLNALIMLPKLYYWAKAVFAVCLKLQ